MISFLIMSNSTERSTILLLCLTSDQNFYVNPQPSVKDLLRIFLTFGPLKKVIVFSKKMIFKAFLEFEDMLSAQEAQQTLNDNSIEIFGRAKLYFSALQELDNSNKFLEYWDSSLEIPIEENVNIRTPFTCISDFGNVFFPKPFASSEPRFGSEEKRPLGQTTLRASDSFEKSDKSPSKEKTILEPSSVILISNLDSEFTTARELFNLFSCFGFVSKILMMKNLRKALVEYRGLESATNAVNGINDCVLSRLKIKANFSKFPRIDLKKNNKSENSQHFNEVIVPSWTQNRFLESESEKTQKVSNSLLISCDNTFSSVRSLDIYLAIKEVAHPFEIKLIDQREDESSLLAVKVEFKDSDSAIIVLSKLHGCLIKNAPLSVGFYP